MTDNTLEYRTMICPQDFKAEADDLCKRTLKDIEHLDEKQKTAELLRHLRHYYAYVCYDQIAIRHYQKILKDLNIPDTAPRYYPITDYGA